MKRILFVGLSRPHNQHAPGSLIIRWGENLNRWSKPRTWFNLFRASHTFIAYPAHRFRPFYMVSEAAGSQVRFMSKFNFEAHSKITDLYKINCDLLDYKAIVLYSELYAGTPYAFMENLGIAWVRIVRIVAGLTVRNPFGSGEQAQKCSELVIRNVVLRLLKSKGIDLKALKDLVLKHRAHELPLDIENIGVRDIFEILEMLSDMKVIERVSNNDPMKAEELALAA